MKNKKILQSVFAGGLALSMVFSLAGQVNAEEPLEEENESVETIPAESNVLDEEQPVGSDSNAQEEMESEEVSNDFASESNNDDPNDVLEEKTIEETPVIEDSNIEEVENYAEEADTKEITVLFVLHDNVQDLYDKNYYNAKFEIRTYEEVEDFTKLDFPDGYQLSASGEPPVGYQPDQIDATHFIMHLATQEAWDAYTYDGIDVSINYINIETGEPIVDYYVNGLKVDKDMSKVVLYPDEVPYVHKGYEIVGESFPITYQEDEYGYMRGYCEITVKKNPEKQQGTLKVSFVADINGTFKEVGTAEIDLTPYQTDDGLVAVKTSDLIPYLPSGYELYPEASSDYYILFAINNDFVYYPRYEEVLVVPKKGETVVTGPEVNEKNPVGIEITPELNAILQSSYDEALKAKVDEALKNGKTVSIEIQSNTDVDSSDKALIDAYAQDNDATIADYFDLSIAVVDSDDNTLGYITETTEPLSFTYQISQNLIQKNREFSILKVHNGKVSESKIEGVQSTTFTSNQFSTFALMIKDNESTIPSDEEETPSDSETTEF